MDHNAPTLQHDQQLQQELYSLVALQIGDIQSYVSSLYLLFACEQSSLIFLVDNGPWSESRSRPAELWQLILTKSRVSPFANQRLRRRISGPDGDSNVELTREKSVELVNTGNIRFRSWDKLVSRLQRFGWNLVHSRIFCPLFHGCVAFEVSWGDVRGMNYLNELQTDTCLALEVKCMRKREFDSLKQAVEFYGGETGCHQPGKRERSSHSPSETDRCKRQCLDEDNHACNGFTTPVQRHFSSSEEKTAAAAAAAVLEKPTFLSETPETPVFCSRRRLRSGDIYRDKQEVPVAHTYRDALVVFRFSDPFLPFQLRDIITSNQRLLQMLESGLPPWVVFLQSYPLLCKLYRPWMRPLARTVYFLISVVTVMIGFYDLYKNVPVLKATAAHMLGPLFEWIEQWEMVSRLKYLGTMLVLQNYEKAFMWFLMSFKAVRQLLSLLMRPVLEPLLLLWSFFLPFWITVAEGLQSLGIFLGSIFNVVAWPFCAFLATLWNLVYTILCPMVSTVRVIFSLPVAAVQYIGELWTSFSSDVIKFITEAGTMMSHTVQFMWVTSPYVTPVETPRSPSVWRLLWDDLFSKVFRAVRYILNGLVAFFTALNRHRLSIYNNMVAFLVRMVYVLESARGTLVELWLRINPKPAAADKNDQLKED